MKKILILILLNTIYSQDATLSFGAVNLSNSTIEIVLSNTVPVTGFQFEVNTDSLITIDTATGGSAEVNSFTINIGTNNNLLLGYSTNQSEIPTGEDILTMLNYTGFGHTIICMSNALIVNGYEELTELNTTYGDCITLDYILGDVNIDGVINVADIVIMVSFILENTYPTEYEEWSSDISEDGEINISDIVMTIYCIFNNCNENIDPPEPGIVTDYDGNSYETIIIGTQEWMSENLKTTHYNNGNAIQYVQSESYEPNVWENLSTGAYGYYNDDLSHQETYGNLYNWYTVDDDRGICPVDWHVPSDEEYKTLEMYLGMSQSEADGTGWRGTNEGSKLAGNASLWSNGILESNAEFGTSGFTGVPSGYRDYDDGNYNYIGYYGYFWSSPEGGSNDAGTRGLYYYGTNVSRYDYNKPYGFSVRCVRN